MALFLFIVFIVILTALAAGSSGGARATYDPSPPPLESPSASPSPSPSPTPSASATTVERARKARRQAVDAWERNRRIRKCFLLGQRALPPRLPLRSASEETWKRALQRQLHATAQLRGENAERRRKMTHPGGSSNGVRWKPLMRWTGWPEHALPMLARIVMRESSGRQNAYNASSACAGLLQLHPGWYRGHWGVPAGDPFDPEYNLRTGRIIWGRCGWSPWAATYY